MKNKNNPTIKEAKIALEHFCSYQERTHLDILNKLKKMNLNSEERQSIISSLIADDFLSEERYAKSFVSGKFRINKWGRIKIRRALLQKGISEQNIKTGFIEINDDEYHRTIQDLINKKQSKIKAENEFERKQKIALYLKQKGYEMSLIYRYVLNV